MTESVARRTANAALTKILLRKVELGEKEYPQYKAAWDRHRRTLEATNMKAWTEKLSDQQLMELISNPNKIVKKWSELAGLTSGNNVKSKLDEILLAQKRVIPEMEVHHIFELYESEGIAPKGASREWYMEINRVRDELGFTGGSGVDSTRGIVKGEHQGFAVEGGRSIGQYSAAHPYGTDFDYGENWETPADRPDLRGAEQWHQVEIRKQRLSHIIDNPNSYTNRLIEFSKDLSPKEIKYFKTPEGRAKLDKMYPDVNPGTMWEIASKPGVNVNNRAATPEEIEIMERGKSGKKEDVDAAQALQRQFMDELGGVGPDGKPAPIQSMYGKRRAANKLAKAGLGAAGLSILGAGSSLAETAIRADIATTTNDPADYLQMGLSGISGLSDFLPVFGELISTPADYANKRIDINRGFAKEDQPVSKGVQQAAQQTQKTGVAQGNTPMPMTDAQQTLESLERIPGDLVQTGKQAMGALGSLWEKLQKGSQYIDLSGYSGF